MKKKHLIKKELVLIVFLLMIISSFSINSATLSIDQKSLQQEIKQQTIPITIQIYGVPGPQYYQTHLLPEDANNLTQQIQHLQQTIQNNPTSPHIPHLQQQLIQNLQQHHLIPNNPTTNKLLTQLQKQPITQPKATHTTNENHATAWFCNFLTTGTGSTFPIIILPRLIPFLLTPIPRLFVRWQTNDGITRCGSLTSGKGFIATEMQDGFALGFWGIGFSIFIPPLFAYGLFGYALYASVNAEHIEPWPPNEPPIISNENPPHGAWDIPLTTNELSFDIYDGNNEPMTYTVTTNPDIGSGTQNNVESGTYTIPIHDLTYNTRYTWTIIVTDGITDTIEEYSFYTEEQPFDPFQEGWQYRKQITIDHTQVPADLTNFPILITTTDTDLRDKAQPDGDDILFMNGPGTATRLYHEIEHYNSATGTLIAWVNIMNLYSNYDTNCYLYYGNPSCNNQQSTDRTWNYNYLAVYHMNDDSSGILDSTISKRNGIEIGNPVYKKPGIIEYSGIEFDGNYDGFDIPNDFGFYQHDFSLECWAKFDSYPQDKLCELIGIQGEVTGALFWWSKSSINQHGVVWGGLYNSEDKWRHINLIENPTDTTNFHYYAATINHNNLDEAYFDGFLVSSQINNGLRSHTHDNGIGLRVEYNDEHFDGIIDEVRISKNVRSPEWILTTYNTIIDPLGFLNIGPEET